MAINISYPTSVSGIIVLLINNQEILLDFADFALQVQLEDNLIVSISRAWYNGSYTMAAKPIKSLELHYRMVQFLIKKILNFQELSEISVVMPYPGDMIDLSVIHSTNRSG